MSDSDEQTTPRGDIAKNPFDNDEDLTDTTTKKPSTPASCDPTEHDSDASSATSYTLSPELFQQNPPKILWSCVARNDIILAEANDVGNHDREDVADAARQLLQQRQTPGFEYHTQNRLKGMLKANFGKKHKSHEKFVPLKGIKFHVFEHVAEDSLRFHEDAPELRVWVFAAVFDPNGTCRADVQSFLEKIVHITDDLRTYDPEWKAARTLGLQSSFAPVLQQRMEEVTYLGKVSLLKQQVHACQEQMEHNIDLMLDNAGRAESLDEEASHLQEMCKVFRKKAKQVKRHQMLKNAKYGLVAGTAATGVAAAVIVPLVAFCFVGEYSLVGGRTPIASNRTELFVSSGRFDSCSGLLGRGYSRRSSEKVVDRRWIPSLWSEEYQPLCVTGCAREGTKNSGLHSRFGVAASHCNPTFGDVVSDATKPPCPFPYAVEYQMGWSNHKPMGIFGPTVRSAAVVAAAAISETCHTELNTFKTLQLAELTNVTLQKTSGVGSLCTLVRIDEDGNQIPVAKSYHGVNWERAGGTYASSIAPWQCESDTCFTDLPAGEYRLQTRETSRPSQKDSIARFLQLASFGPTAQDLETFSGSFANHIKNQIEMEPTFHREYYRQHANPSWPFHKPEFASNLDPCHANTTWRIYAFGVEDSGKFIDVKKVGDRWEVKMDGFVRTMAKELRFTNKAITIAEGRYQVCGGRRNMQLGRFSLKVGTLCRRLILGDLKVQFPNDFSPPHMISGKQGRLTNAKIWAKTTSVGHSHYVRLNQLGKARCSSIPVALKDGRSQPVFLNTTIGEWLIHEPRVAVAENSLESPLIDGGRVALANNRTLSCANAPRTVFNEKFCIMSNKSACLPGSKSASESKTGTIVCGSPGEIPNDPMKGDTLLEIGSIATNARSVALGLPKDPNTAMLNRQREFIWSQIALNAKDQLRQRVAFALMQIFALPKTSISSELRHTEIFLHYYDIFVRHAFGNYRDILLETTYNPLMAESLSFANSHSIGYSFSKNGNLRFPDENFAREIQQLFTIGLVETDMYGTPILDSTNKTIRTYDSEDIISMAKAWTGFQYQKPRANIETSINRNRIDPLRLNPGLRDRFPKANLYGGYFGDQYPLCVDLPKKAFLLKGAKYRLLGTHAEPELVTDNPSWSSSSSAKRLVLRPNTSGLYERLCSASAGNECSYPGVVELVTSLNCADGKGLECGGIDVVRIVKVNNVYYEYVPNFRCVNYSFFLDGIKAGGRTQKAISVCADPKLPVAGAACCSSESTIASSECAFAGERMSLETAKVRCEDKGLKLCNYTRYDVSESCPNIGSRWTQTPCQVEAKVDSTGAVAIVHNTGGAVRDFVKESSPSFFRVNWTGGSFPTTTDNCGGGACRVFDRECICQVDIRSKAVFNKAPANRNALLTRLHVGYPDPALFNGVDLQRKVIEGSTSWNGYAFYSSDGSCCNEDTIFEVTEPISFRTLYLKNTISTVSIAGTGKSQYSFRNPVQFNSVDPNEYSKTDASWETEAVIDHLLYHKNTAPFVAYRLIQRFGISNPTPRFIRTVANAFRRGEIKRQGITFGSAHYGSMEATIAAILLDREFTLYGNGYDPAFGSLREPIIKVIGFMRAAGFKSSTPLIELDLMESKIGQAPYAYSPPGVAANSTLVAPEAEVMSSGRTVGILNGLFSLVDDGLVACNNGFGFNGCKSTNTGSLEYFPTSIATNEEVVNDLASLFTGGRLSRAKRDVIERVVEKETDVNNAGKLALKLIATSPEFHTSNLPDTFAKTESSPTDQNTGRGRYRVVIHIALEGGCDSFNVLMPHETCTEAYNEYKTTRGSIAIPPSTTLDLGGNTTGQPCDKFALHDQLPVVQELYDKNDLLFLANTGVLSEPVTKSDYKAKTLTQLFSHSDMQNEIKRLDPRNDNRGTGSLGRMADVLESRGFRTGRTAIEAGPLNLAGLSTAPEPIFTLDENGVALLNITDLSSAATQEVIEFLNGQGIGSERSGVFGEVWSSTLSRSLNQTEKTFYLLQQNVNTNTEFGTTSLDKRVKLVSQLVQTRKERGVDRDFFFLTYGSFDHHSSVGNRLATNLGVVNNALRDLVAELKHLGVWNDTLIVQTSDFARTLVPNSNEGSDHGWGGNYMMAGGRVNGNRIIGTYPSLKLDSDVNADEVRGRIIPTTSWDAVFRRVAQWMGVQVGQAEQIDYVIPNHRKFPAGDLRYYDLFTK